jgi:hypothetical protein
MDPEKSFETEAPLEFNVTPKDVDLAVTYAARLLLDADRASNIIHRFETAPRSKILGSHEYTEQTKIKIKEYEAKRDSLKAQAKSVITILSTFFRDQQQGYWTQKVEQAKRELLDEQHSAEE